MKRWRSSAKNAFQRLMLLANGRAAEAYSVKGAVADYLTIHPECDKSDVRRTLDHRLAACIASGARA